MARKVTETRKARKGAAARKRPVTVASKVRKAATNKSAAKQPAGRKRSKSSAAKPRKRQQRPPSLKSIVEALDAYVAARRARRGAPAGGLVAEARALGRDDWEAMLGRARVEMRRACESTPAFG